MSKEIIKLAREQFQARELKLCAETLRQALAHEPYDPDLNAELGILLCHSQDMTEAFDCLLNAKGAERFDKLSRILYDHFYCRKLLAKKIGQVDELGDKLFKRIQEISGITQTDVGITLSAILITKNEEKNLERCLKSLEGVVDEIVVVDTGSTDNTVEIAKRFGAKTGYFEWCNDFSAARNASLELATGHWCLWIDADEELEAKGKNNLFEALLHPHFGAYNIPILSYISNEIDANQYIHTPTRLFRRLPEVKFEGRIHEQILAPIQRLGFIDCCLYGVRLIHYGYMTQEMAEKNKLDRTISMLLREVEEDPTDAFHLFNLANAYTVAGRFEETVEYCRKAEAYLDMSTSYAIALYQIWANAHLELGQPSQALEVCNLANKKGADNLIIEYQRAYAYARLKNFEKALDCVNRSLEMGWPEGLVGDHGVEIYRRHALKAQILVDMERYDEAEEYVDHVLKVAPQEVAVLLCQGVIFYARGQWAEAIRVFDSFVIPPIIEPTVKRYMAHSYKELQDYEKASTTLQNLWEQGQRSVEIFSEWAEVCELLGEPQRMLEAYEAFSQQGEIDVPILVNWGRALRAAGDYEKALHCFAEAVKREPTNSNALFNCGDLLYQLGQHSDAALMYESGLRLRPDYAMGWVMIGNSLCHLGLLSGARTAYEQALRLDPDNHQAQNNLEYIREEEAGTAA